MRLSAIRSLTAGARRLLLVRHGLPDYRVRQAGDEVPGPPLSAIGLDQAHQAAEVVAAYAPVALYSSPLARTWQTADCIGARLKLVVSACSELKEWHRTESLFEVSQRGARWLGVWLRQGEASAVVVSHASPLLAILRSVLYLPHRAWHHAGRPDMLQLGTSDRFEVSMGSVTVVTVSAAEVTAEMVFHPEPRVIDVQRGRRRRCYPRPILGDGENVFFRRPNLTHLIGGGRPEGNAPRTLTASGARG